MASPVFAQWLPAVEVEVKLADGEVYEAALNPLLKDRAGLLWLARYGEGVGRYDGEIMTTYGEEEGINCGVTYIKQDTQGYIWLGGDRKGANTTTLLRSTVPFPAGEEPQNVRFTDSVPGLLFLNSDLDNLKTDAKGQVWASTNGLLVRYNYTSAGQLRADTILTSPDERIVGCGFGADGELFVLRGDSILYSSTIDYQPGDDFVLTPLEGLVSKGTNVTIGPEGGLWIKSTTRMERYDIPPSGLGNGIAKGERLNATIKGRSNLVFVNKETTLLGVPDALLEIDNATMTVRKEYSHAADLNIPGMQQILNDGLGNIWIGTVTGLARMPIDYQAYASPNERTMGQAARIPENTNVQTVRMGGPDGKWLIVGTTTGLFIRSETNEWQKVGKEEGLLLPNILGLAGDGNGRIWAASTAAGVNLISPPELIHPMSVRPADLTILGKDYVLSGVTANYMYSPFVLPLARQGGAPDVFSLWGGNGYNGQVLTDQQPWLWLTDTTGYTGGPIMFFAQDKLGHVLTASQNGTLLRSAEPFTYEYHEQRLQNVEVKREGVFLNSLDTAIFKPIELKWDTTTFPIVLGMAAIEDELWLGVTNGALVLDLETLGAKAFIPMPGPDCEPKDFAYDRSRNRIWAASSCGIWEIDVENYRLQRMITEEDGLRGNVGFSPQCITVGPAGTVYYTTSKGLAAYRPEFAHPQPDSFSVYVRKREFQEDAWGKNEVALSFAALDYREAKKVYQTKLEGYDEDWSETTKNATLRYTNLPAYLSPKTYQFRVRSQTDDGGWIENAVAAPVTVSPPWYFSWWAVLIGLGLLALAIRWFLRFQLQRQAEALALKEAAVIKQQRDEIKQKNDQNELLLKEIHHRVKNNLEVVSSLLELQSAGLSDSEARDAMQAGQSRVQSMGLLHQKLYQGENLAAIEMKDYFHNLADSLLETYEAEERIKVNINMKALELDVDTAVPLGLIVNELLTNTIKYAFEGAAAGAVEVGLSKDGSDYLLRVTDNGAGKDFDASATGTGFGTRLVSLLAKQLGGSLTETNDGGLKTELRFGEPS